MSIAVPGAPSDPRPRTEPDPIGSVPRSGQGSHRALITDALDNRRCPRRVRYEVRDGVTVAAFSAASSTVAALAFSFLLSRVG